jgi:nitrate reductase delta subunit
MNKENERKIFLIASFLLQYPDDDWYELLGEIEAEALEMKDESYVEHIFEFLKYVKQTNKLDLAQLYVETFDLSKKTNLYLTYYSLEEKQERGLALLKLKRKYEEAGFMMETSELPDFLPVVLEFTAATQRKDMLENYRTAIEEIFNSLSKENNPYLYVLKSILLVVMDTKDDSAILHKLDKEINYVSVGGVII